MHAAAPRVPHVWRWDTLYPLADGPATWFRSAAAASAGPSRWPTPACPARLRHADAVGSDPVPRAARGRARTPAQPERVPVRRRGRGCLDRCQRRSRRDAPRGLPADPGLELPRPPQRNRPADGLDRRPGHPVRPLHRHRVLRIRLRTGHRRVDPGRLPLRTALGPPRAPAAVRPAGHASAPRSAPTGGNTPTLPWANSWSWRTRGTPPPSRPGTPRSGTSTPPPAGTCCPPSAPSSTGCGRASPPVPAGRSDPRVWQVFDGTGPSPSTARSISWPRVTCSSCRPGSPGPHRRRTTSLDLFRFSDAPVVERLHFDRVHIGGGAMRLTTFGTPTAAAAAAVRRLAMRTTTRSSRSRPGSPTSAHCWPAGLA